RSTTGFRSGSSRSEPTRFLPGNNSSTSRGRSLIGPRAGRQTVPKPAVSVINGIAAPTHEQRIGRVDDRGVLVLVVELVEEVPHRVQPGSLLVIALDRDPRGVVGVRAAEGLLLGLRVVLPPVERFEVHRRQLPPPHRIDLT